MADISDKWETRHEFDLNNDPSEYSNDEEEGNDHIDNSLDQDIIWDEATDDDSHEFTNFGDEATNVSYHEDLAVGRYYTFPGGKPVKDLTDEQVLALTFSSEEECISFYMELGWCTGFGVRLNERKKNKSGEVRSRSLCCSFEGFRQTKYLESEPGPRGKRNLTRCGCEALIKFKFDRKIMKWCVRSYKSQHNHQLIDAKIIHQHRSYREINEADRRHASSLKDLGLDNGRVMSVFADERGGYDKMGFIPKDMYNTYHKQKKEILRQGDVNRTLTYLIAKQDTDELCTYKVSKGNDGRLEHLFWSDSQAILDYRFFSDVVTFDATYKTNIYKRPLVLFVGTNNHCQTILFGTALLANEEESSYIWLLQAFNECHKGRHPGSVITDSSKAMRNAVSTVWPKSIHRLCSWHLQRNIQGQFQNADLTDEYMRLMFRRCSTEEFERSWRKLLDDYNIPPENGWASENYNKRKHWARAYLSGVFFAGMTTTQRSEGINSFVKKVVSRRVRIYKLVEDFDKGLIRWRLKVFEEVYKTRHTRPVMQTGLPDIEKHASNIYSYSFFRKFLKVLKADQQFFVQSKEDATIGSSRVRICTVMKSGNHDRRWIVNYLSEKNLIQCSCKLLEEAGMPCSHIIATIKSEHLQQIPSCCIITRWTKDAMSGNELGSSVSGSGNVNSNTSYAALMLMCKTMCYDASQHPERSSICRDGIVELNARINACQISSAEGSNPVAPDVDVGDPETAQGRFNKSPPPPKRTRTRKCSKCMEPGHTVTTCRVRKEEQQAEREAAILQRARASASASAYYSQPESTYWNIPNNHPQPPPSSQPGSSFSYPQPYHDHTQTQFNFGSARVGYPQQPHMNPAPLGGLYGHMSDYINSATLDGRVFKYVDRQPGHAGERAKHTFE